MKTKYKIVKSFKEVKKIVEYCKKTKYASVDFETKAKGPLGSITSKNDKKPAGFQYDEDEPTILGVCFQPGSGYSIPLFHKDAPYSRKKALKILRYFGKEVCENIEITKIAHNLKFEYKWFFRYGIKMSGRLFDSMLAKYLLEEEKPHDLKSLVVRFIPEYAGYEDVVKGMVFQYKGWENIPLKPLSKYCATDCDLTFRLMMFFEKKLVKLKFYDLFRNMCMMQTRVLAESEFMGLDVDREYLVRIEREQRKLIEKNHEKLMSSKVIRRFQKWRIKSKIEDLIETTQEEIRLIKKGLPIKEGGTPYKNPETAIRNREDKLSRYIAGELVTKKEIVEEVNFNSPNQMVELLFTSPKGFNFDIIKYTKYKETKQETDRPSTDEEVLLELELQDKTGFITALLKNRELTKLHSTYMVSMLEKLTPKDRIHGSFLIHGTVTGRLSSKNPNLQNIPRDCIGYNTKFLSDRGWLTIGNLVPNKVGVYNNTIPLKVLTHRGNYKNVTHFVNKGLMDMVKIKFDNGTELECTLDHRILTVYHGWQKVRDIIKHNYECRNYKIEERAVTQW